MPKSPTHAALIKAIAAHLGPDWTAKRTDRVGDDWQLREAGTGRVLTAHVGSGGGGAAKGRLVVGGFLPPNPPGLSVNRDNLYADDITCAVTRSAASIAGDITRRLLPAYDESREELRRRCERQAQANRRRSDFADHLATVPGVERQKYNQDPNHRQNLSWAGAPWPANTDRINAVHTPRASVSVEWSGPGDGIGYANIELTGLSAAQAELVLRALAEAERPPAPAPAATEPARIWTDMEREDFTGEPQGLFPALPSTRTRRGRTAAPAAQPAAALF